MPYPRPSRERFFVPIRDLMEWRTVALCEFAKGRFGVGWKRMIAERAGVHDASVHQMDKDPRAARWRTLEPIERACVALGWRGDSLPHGRWELERKRTDKIQRVNASLRSALFSRIALPCVGRLFDLTEKAHQPPHLRNELPTFNDISNGIAHPATDYEGMGLAVGRWRETKWHLPRGATTTPRTSLDPSGAQIVSIVTPLGSNDYEI